MNNKIGASAPLYFKGGIKMDLNIKTIIQLYKEELAKLQNENIILKAQILQMQQVQQNQEVDVEESGDEE